ncbi:MAG: 2-amino-4-hydroxy-6-hydroxymethyldihydropteridine diphosphokinase [Terracidiphilus sp.]
MHTAYIGMGANMASRAGAPEATLKAAVERLSAIGKLVMCSSLYSTAPEGFKEQPRFVNAVLGLETGLAPRPLLRRLLEIEGEFGRDRFSSLPNGPRTLDLDLLIVGDLVLHEAGLDLPHPRLAERAFVLVPLHEIAPRLIEPRSRSTIEELLNALKNELPVATDAVVRLAGRDWSVAR